MSAPTERPTAAEIAYGRGTLGPGAWIDDLGDEWARLIQQPGGPREPTRAADVGVTWYPTLDDIYAAFVEGWAEGEDVRWGGETPDGEEAEFTTADMKAGMGRQGMWGFERGGMIHLWAQPEHVETKDFAHLVAHEIAHAACAHDGTMDDEMEAERYGEVAVRAVEVVDMVRTALRHPTKEDNDG